jgi:hypothetical protein
MILESLIVPLLMDDKDFKEKSEKAQKTGNKLSDGLSLIGGGVVTGGLGLATVAVGGLTAGLVSSFETTNEWAGTLDGIQDVLGGTSLQASGLAVMMQRIGGDSEQVTGAMKKLTMGLVSATGELGPTGLALQNLGISAYDSNGQIKDAYTLFGEVANATAGMDDGLAKSQILMDVFGKSGAELGDALSAAANGGMLAFQTEAQELGLALDPSPIIEQQKAQEKLKQTLMGLQVTAGSALIPVMSELSGVLQVALNDPDVKKGIKDIATSVGGFASLVIKEIPTVINFLKEIPDFFEKNKPLVVGILAALGVAVGFFVYSTVIPAALAAGASFVAMMAPLLPAIAIMAAVGAAAYLLYQAWDTNFLGIRDTMTEVWNTVEPIFNWIGDIVGGYLTRQFENFQTIVQWVSDRFNELSNALSNLELPDWLTPGSPPPLYFALLDVKSAMNDLSKKTLPDFTSEISMSGVNPTASLSPVNNNNEIISILADIRNKPNIDEDRLALILKDAILQAVG